MVGRPPKPDDLSHYTHEVLPDPSTRIHDDRVWRYRPDAGSSLGKKRRRDRAPRIGVDILTCHRKEGSAPLIANSEGIQKHAPDTTDTSERSFDVRARRRTRAVGSGDENGAVSSTIASRKQLLWRHLRQIKSSLKIQVLHRVKSSQNVFLSFFQTDLHCRPQGARALFSRGCLGYFELGRHEGGVFLLCIIYYFSRRLLFYHPSKLPLLQGDEVLILQIEKLLPRGVLHADGFDQLSTLPPQLLVVRKVRQPEHGFAAVQH